MPSLLATLRPAGALGDLNDATVITHSASRSTPGITLGSYELMSPLIGSVAPAGTIDYLIFFARAQVVLTGAAFQSTAFIRWLEEFGPTTREIEFWTSALTNLDSGQIATMQNGSPWGWSAFVDVALGISGDYELVDTSSIVVTLADVWIEAWGTPTAVELETASLNVKGPRERTVRLDPRRSLSVD